MTIQPQITEKPAFTVVGVRIRTNPKSGEIAQLWSNHGASLINVPNMTQDGSYGVMEMIDMEADEMDYMAAVGVSEVGDIPDGMSQWDIPAATYAVFEATLPTLGASFDEFYGEWLPTSDYNVQKVQNLSIMVQASIPKIRMQRSRSTSP